MWSWLPCWVVSYLAAIFRWYWLNWTMIQVIMIARLHAMYQRSRMMLIFLVVIFLAINIACVVIAVIGLDYMVLGKLYLRLQEHNLLGKNQRRWHSLACICAIMDLRGMPSSFFQSLGFSTLFGRFSHCVFQSGLLWNTSVTCDDLAHRQDWPLGTVSRCW
jgi:hypothetical protein